MNNYHKTKNGNIIDLNEIACCEKINHRIIFSGDKEIKAYDYMIVLRCGHKIYINSEYYSDDIEEIENSIPRYAKGF